jgi:hypothetical protein
MPDNASLDEAELLIREYFGDDSGSHSVDWMLQEFGVAQ